MKRNNIMSLAWRRFVLIALMTISALPAIHAAQVTFHSEHLKAAATKLSLTKQIEALGVGTNYIQYGSRRLEVRINSDRQVEHLGVPLFPIGQRKELPSPIYDFLEYAVLDNVYKVSQNPFVYSTVSFQKGSWQEMAALSDTTACQVDNLESKYYKVKWTRGGVIIVELTFPVSYDMLAGSSRKEMELNFVRDLRRFVGTSVKDTARIDDTDLQLTDNGLYVRLGGSYILPTITDNVYFVKEGSLLRYVSDRRYPSETLANMVLADDPLVSECDINVKFVLYGSKRDSLLLPLKTFMRYCRSKGCDAYFGIESADKNAIKASLFFYNEASGYDHVVYITAPMQNFAQRDYTIEGIMYLYAPTSNVENLFYKPKNQKKKEIKYEN